MVKDQEIFDLIEREHQRQLKGMELIASENFVSDEVMNAMGSYLTNKYAEGLPGKRYYLHGLEPRPRRPPLSW